MKFLCYLSKSWLFLRKVINKNEPQWPMVTKSGNMVKDKICQILPGFKPATPRATGEHFTTVLPKKTKTNIICIVCKKMIKLIKILYNLFFLNKTINFLSFFSFHSPKKNNSTIPQCAANRSTQQTWINKYISKWDRYSKPWVIKDISISHPNTLSTGFM